jgi:hypothetical protein
MHSKLFFRTAKMFFNIPSEWVADAELAAAAGGDRVGTSGLPLPAVPRKHPQPSRRHICGVVGNAPAGPRERRLRHPGTGLGNPRAALHARHPWRTCCHPGLLQLPPANSLHVPQGMPSPHLYCSCAAAAVTAAACFCSCCYCYYYCCYYCYCYCCCCCYYCAIAAIPVAHASTSRKK